MTRIGGRSDEKRAILLVMHTLLVGGTERQVYLLASGLQKRGWSVDLFSLESRGQYREAFEAIGIPLHDGAIRGDMSRPLFVVGLLRAQWRLFRLTASHRFSVVQAFLPLPNFMAALAGRLARVPLIVISKRNIGAHQDRVPLTRWMDMASNRLSDLITANATAIVADARMRENCNPKKIQVIPNGATFSDIAVECTRRDAVRTELRLKSTEIAVCFVASLSPRKAHQILIAAFARLTTVHPEVKLVLVGEDRGILSKLQNQVEALGLSGRVLFLGNRGDVLRLLEGMDVGVMASQEEGLSNALLEKIAAGLPIAATDVGGNAEALNGMPNCRLVRPRNAEALAQGLREVIETLPETNGQRELRRRLVRKRYSTDAMVDAYERLYVVGKGS